MDMSPSFSPFPGLRVAETKPWPDNGNISLEGHETSFLIGTPHWDLL